MTELLSTIEEIIKRDFKVTFRGGSIMLQEKSIPHYPSTQIKKKGAMQVYKFDVENSNEEVFPIFNATQSGITNICDYIIFYPKNDTLYTFLCDLKSNTTSAKSQVESG